MCSSSLSLSFLSITRAVKVIQGQKGVGKGEKDVLLEVGACAIRSYICRHIALQI